MDQIRRGTLFLLIVSVLCAVLLWYYFTKVYDGDPAVKGTLVEEIQGDQVEGKTPYEAI